MEGSSPDACIVVIECWCTTDSIEINLLALRLLRSKLKQAAVTLGFNDHSLINSAEPFSRQDASWSVTSLFRLLESENPSKLIGFLYNPLFTMA